MKKTLMIGLASLIITLPLIGSCSNDNIREPENNDSENGQVEQNSELSELAKKHNCIDLAAVIAAAKAAGNEATAEEFNVCGIINQITNNENGELVISDSKNAILIKGIVDYDKLENKPKVGDEIVLTGKATNYYSVTYIADAKLVEFVSKESKPDSDNDKPVEPDVKPNPTPTTGTHEEYFVSKEVMNMGDRGNQGSVDSYYESCRGLKGEALKDELYRICQPKERFSYKHNSTSFPYTDVDPDDPSKIVLTYTGERRPINNYGISVNREHTWPNSRGAGTTGPGADKHMIRPTENKINGLRSNYNFGYVEHNSTNDCASFRPQNKGNYYDTSARLFEPKDEYKGDTARMIFYVATLYNGMELEPSSNSSKFNFWSGANLHGDFDALYTWATDINLDPVSKIEMNRNNVIDIKYQHNRNPFIDHPEFVEMIYSKEYNGKGALND